MCSACLSLFLITSFYGQKTKKTINNKSSQYRKQHSICIIQETQWKQKTGKKSKYRIWTCHIVPWASFLSQKATNFTSFCSNKMNRHLKWLPAGWPSREKSRENKKATWHHHVTGPCTWPCSISQNTHTHTLPHTDTHTLQVMQLTHTHALCKTKYKHTLTLTKTSAFDISQNPHILAVPKPKRHLWRKCLIFMVIMLFRKHLTAVGQYCGFVLSAQVDLAAHPVI